jgi:hypothetical protein
MALIKFIERFVVEKHRAIAFEPRLVIHNQTCEAKAVSYTHRTDTVSHILAAVGYLCQLLVTLVNCGLPLSACGCSKNGAYAKPN